MVLVPLVYVHVTLIETSAVGERVVVALVVAAVVVVVELVVVLVVELVVVLVVELVVVVVVELDEEGDGVTVVVAVVVVFVGSARMRSLPSLKDRNRRKNTTKIFI